MRRAGLLGSLLSGHRAIRARSLDSEAGAEGLPAGHPPVLNILAVPIRSADRVYGWIYFADKTGAAEFSVEDERLANIMATKLALLYENLSFYDVIQRHAAKLQIEAAERKRAQEALRASEARFRSLTELSSDWYFEWDAELSIRYTSQGDGRLSGIPAERVLGRKLWDTNVTPLNFTWEQYRADLEARKPFREIEYLRIGDDGNRYYLALSGEPVFDAAGAFMGYRGVGKNITFRKQAEEQLRESERRFSDMLGNVQLVSVMLDREARITYCNEYLLRLTGWRYEEVIGRNWVELFIPPETGNLKDRFAAILADLPEARHRENEILTRSGERRLIRWNNSVLRSAAGEVIGTASIGEDITDRKEAEDKVKALNRVYAVLSGINALIVRVSDRDELFEGACRIAVEAGQFRMSWIGLVDRNAMKIVPVASAGSKPEHMTFIKNQISLAVDTPMGDNLVARAIREKKAFFSNDTQNDPAVRFKEGTRRERDPIGCRPAVAGCG